MKIQSPGIVFTISEYDVSIYTYDPEDASELQVYKVIKVLEKRRSLFRYYWDKWVYKVDISLSLVGLFLYLVFWQKSVIGMFIGAILLTIAVIIMILGIIFAVSKFSQPKITMKNTKDDKNIFARKKDDIYIGIIFLFIGAILGYFLQGKF